MDHLLFALTETLLVFAADALLLLGELERVLRFELLFAVADHLFVFGAFFRKGLHLHDARVLLCFFIVEGIGVRAFFFETGFLCRAALIFLGGEALFLLKALLFRLRFRLAFALRRSSPTGLLVWLERWGARHHAPRGRGETYRAYLGRLSALPGPAEDGALPPALKALADCLDGQYFAGRRTPLPAGAAAAIRRGFSRRPAGEPEKT